MKKNLIAALVFSASLSVTGFLGAVETLTNSAPPKLTSAAAGNEIMDAAVTPRRSRPVYTLAPGVEIPPGPTELNWNSVKANFQVPPWLQDGKFGIFIHWGLYSVPAYHNEWYQKYMYGNDRIRDCHPLLLLLVDVHVGRLLFFALVRHKPAKREPNAQGVAGPPACPGLSQEPRDRLMPADTSSASRRHRCVD